MSDCPRCAELEAIVKILRKQNENQIRTITRFQRESST